ncbi:MAG: lipocalin family protein [Burkholderiaceae bacterium]
MKISSLRKCCLASVVGLAGIAGLAAAQGTQAAKTDMASIPINLTRYAGTWYQVALYPNSFQKQCLSDTSATYRPLPAAGRIEVRNRCRVAGGAFDEALGEAKPAQDASPLNGQLKVRFAPQWLAWLPWVWGDYWVVHLAADYRYAIVSEPQREYLWVLSRTTRLGAADEAAVRALLPALGFDMARVQWHPHTAP